MRFHFLIARRKPDLPSRIILDVSNLLRQRGHNVQCSTAEEMLTGLHDLPCDDDLYLLKSYTELSLSLAGALSERGANLINPYEGCAAARNKIVCYQVLRQAGIPVPRAWITADPVLLKKLLQQFPLILKPYMGWRGEGIQVVRREKDLSGFMFPPTPVLIQEYIEHNDDDLRLYVAGDEVFGIRKRFSRTSFAAEGEPVLVSPEIRAIALCCGEAFGLKLYGIDIIEGANGPVVVDVNYFPGYKGVPGAAYSVAEVIENHAFALRKDVRPDRQILEAMR